MLIFCQIWANYVEEEKVVAEEDAPANEEERTTGAVPDRKTDYQAAVVTEVSDDLRFFVQFEEQGSKLEAMMEELRQAFNTNPPLAGAYTPKKGK
jgi:staphylococcal nuclease domain-containing protein 1